MTRKANTPVAATAPASRTRNAQAKSHPSVEAQLADLRNEQTTIAQALALILARLDGPATPAPAQAVIAPATLRANGKAQKATNAPAKAARTLTPEQQAKRDAVKQRNAGIVARKAQWVAEFTIADAIKFAATEVRKNRKAKAQNAAIFATSPASLRVWLSSQTNQALKAVREREGLRAGDVETMLEAAVA